MNRKTVCSLLFVAAAILLLAPPSAAVVTFTQLDDDIFVVSHRVKGIGLRGKAMKLAYTKTASLCVAAGFSHFEILEEESQSGQQHESANASVRSQFFSTDGRGRIDCERNADPDYVEQAAEKLSEQGYEQPDATQATAAAAPPPNGGGSAGSCGSCTIEQIAAMARSGLSDEQIRAACAGSPGG